MKLRPQFGLRCLFALTALTAWCTWHWSISERRHGIAVDITRVGCSSVRASSAPPERYHDLCKKFGWERATPVPRSFVGAALGYENLDGVKVFFVPHSWIDMPELVSKLSKMPGLTAVIMFDGRPDSEERPDVIAFKEEMKKRCPHVKIEHHHYFDIWIVG